MKLEKVVNPINIFGGITLLAFLATIKFDIYHSTVDINYVRTYILLPYLMYILVQIFEFICRKIKRKKNNQYIQSSTNIKSITMFLLKLYLAICLYIFIDYIIRFGGISGFINSVFRGNSAYELQVNLSGILTLGYQFNVILPVIVMFLLSCNISKNEEKLIGISIVFNAIYSFMVAARILFVINSLSIIIFKYYNYKMSIKRILVLILSGIVIFQLMVFGQMRNVNTDNKQVGKDILSNYYEKSLDNAFLIIDSRISRGSTDGPYWTFRPILNIPVVTKVLNLESIYENYIGNIPIKGRMDDFKYAESLGVNPMYNTFSIYGYSYLDYGFLGIFFILTYFLLVSYFYRNASKSVSYRVLYILLLVSSFDILRTNGIFSATVIVRIIFILFLNIINKVKLQRK